MDPSSRCEEKVRMSWEWSNNPESCRLSLGLPEELRRDVGKQRALLQGGDQRLQAHGMAQSEEIQTANPEQEARTEAGDASRRIERGGAAANASDFRAHADVHRISSGLFQRVKHVLGGLVAVGILDGRVDARKNAEVV